MIQEGICNKGSFQDKSMGQLEVMLSVILLNGLFSALKNVILGTGDLGCHMGPKNATQKPMVVWCRYMLGQSKKPV